MYQNITITMIAAFWIGLFVLCCLVVFRSWRERRKEHKLKWAVVQRLIDEIQVDDEMRAGKPICKIEEELDERENQCHKLK